MISNIFVCVFGGFLSNCLLIFLRGLLSFLLTYRNCLCINPLLEVIIIIFYYLMLPTKSLFVHDKIHPSLCFKGDACDICSASTFHSQVLYSSPCSSMSFRRLHLARLTQQCLRADSAGPGSARCQVHRPALPLWTSLFHCYSHGYLGAVRQGFCYLALSAGEPERKEFHQLELAPSPPGPERAPFIGSDALLFFVGAAQW